ncbi:MAG: hypothetical protein V1738_03925, partial [Patescibacteria group bacterium]
MSERLKKYLPLVVGTVAGLSIWLAIFGLDLFAFLRLNANAEVSYSDVVSPLPIEPTINIAEYDERLLRLAQVTAVEDVGTVAAAPAEEEDQLWPVVDAPYPKVGAILPFKR